MSTIDLQIHPVQALEKCGQLPVFQNKVYWQTLFSCGCSCTVLAELSIWNHMTHKTNQDLLSGSTKTLPTPVLNGHYRMDCPSFLSFSESDKLLAGLYLTTMCDDLKAQCRATSFTWWTVKTHWGCGSRTRWKLRVLFIFIDLLLILWF